MLQATSTIKQYGDIASEPSQTYGNGEVILRIGNGGAGGTGLIAALALDYLSLRGSPGSIQWICNHSRNTQLALLYGFVDIALTYERSQEDIAVKEGWAKNAGCVFHDHFCLAGPESDPANAQGATSIEEAFQRIATARCQFHSRADGSATMWKERDIWRRGHREPWKEDSDSQWYIQTQYNPANAVTQADAANAYLLIDRSTFLSQVTHGLVSHSTVFFEPTDDTHLLMNSCYALYGTQSSPVVAKEALSFIQYLKSKRGQEIIATYGKDTAGIPLFASVNERLARADLTGGKARNGRWMLSNQRESRI